MPLFSRAARPAAGPSPLSTLAAGKARNLGAWTTTDVSPSAPTDFHRSDYSSIVLDQANNRILFWGGGGNIGGHDTNIRVFDLSTLAWSSIGTLIPWANLVPANATNNGTWTVPAQPAVAVNRHSYNGTCVLGNKFYSFSNAVYLIAGINGADVSPTGPIWLPIFNFATGQWSFDTANGSIGAYFANGSCPTTDGRAFIVTAWGDAHVYDPASQTVTNLSVGTPALSTPAVVYFPPNGKYYSITPNWNVYEFTLNLGNLAASTVTQLTTTGAPSVTGPQYLSFSYDAVNHVLGGTMINGTYNTFDPVSRYWRQEYMQLEAGSSGIPDTVFHCSARDPNSGCLILLGSDSMTWAYRPATPPPPLPSSDLTIMSDLDHDGATWYLGNQVVKVPWVNAGGDWRDANNVQNGTNHYGASASLGGAGNYTISCASLITRLLTTNTGIYLNGNFHLSPFPTLSVTASGSGTTSPPLTVQCYLDPSSGTLPAAGPGIYSPGIIKFDLSGVVGTVSAATLTVHSTGGGSGPVTADYVDAPSMALSGPVVQGLANTVAKDSDLAGLSQVLLYDNLTSQSYITNNFLTISQTAPMEFLDWAQYGLTAARIWATPINQKLIGWRHAAEPVVQTINSTPHTLSYGKTPGSGYTHLFTRWLMRIGPDLMTGMNELGMKLPGFDGNYDLATSGADASPYNNPNDAWNGTLWHTPISHSNPHRYRMYIYYYGQDHPYPVDFSQATVAYLKAGQIHCIESEVQLNTPTLSNGVFRVWLDGVQVFENTALKIRANDTTRIECIPFMLIYHGGLGFPLAPFHYDVGGICTATQYIGPPKVIA